MKLTNPLFYKLDYSPQKVAIWLVCLLSFAYPISACIPTILGASSRPFNMAYRLVCVAMAVYIILVVLGRKKEDFKTSIPIYLFLAFWLVYSIRLFIDISILKVPNNVDTNFAIYSFAFGNCLLPSLAILLIAKKINLNKALPVMFGLVLSSNIIIFLLVIVKQGFSLEILQSRLWLASDEGKATINPITISLYGSYLFILSLIILITKQWRLNMVKRSGIIIALLLGLLNIMMGASRGPMLFTALALVVILVNAWRLNRFSIRGLLKFFVVGIALTVAFALFVWPSIADVDLEFITRISFSFEKGLEGEERDLSITAAWHDFLRHPFLGSSFVGTFDGYYPHNIVVEALMATGVLGGFFFISFLGFVIFKSFMLLRQSKYFPFGMIMLAIIFTSLLSGALFMGVDLWPWSVLIASTYHQKLAVD
ncbi:O-antigen ligase family protein [Aridibaculum aurantiacum]|uniref:O-antigen ligase family protein n=1 Tax=Aridibaculum aurantiacum TaxID=2810307 RepID=UPI001A974C42|nr:O-antigen ligase family protein [Aridibaculum aurantiacum]